MKQHTTDDDWKMLKDDEERKRNILKFYLAQSYDIRTDKKRETLFLTGMQLIHGIGERMDYIIFKDGKWIVGQRPVPSTVDETKNIKDGWFRTGTELIDVLWDAFITL